ncbi:hypothetical protein EZS27_030599 [termite gut metagenome]|uniref:Uncharacterized protein n=1 Tax=termite gut metagenome TaxID=433724 RepID=A0A5J4QCT9_9ZZZZ
MAELFETMVKRSRAKQFARFHIVTHWVALAHKILFFREMENYFLYFCTHRNINNHIKPITNELFFKTIQEKYQDTSR